MFSTLSDQAMFINQYFCKTYNKQSDIVIKSIDKKNQIWDVVTETNIINANESTSSSTSVGVNKIPYFSWKNIISSSANILSVIFTRFFSENFVPTKWKLSLVVPIFKNSGS